MRHKAKRRRKTLETEKDTNQLLQLDGDISCFNAAFNLSHPPILQRQLSEMQADIKTLRVERRIKPIFSAKLHVTATFVQDLIAKDAFEEAAESFVPWEVTPAAWNELAPRFGPLIKEIETDDDAKSLAAHMRTVHYGNSASNLWAEPVENASVEDLPFQWAGAVLRLYESAPSELLFDLPDLVVAAFDESMKGDRAVTAMCCTTPGELGSTYQDALDIFGDSGFARTAEQDAMRSAAMKSKDWRQRIVVYWNAAKDDDTIGPIYQGYLKTLALAPPVSEVDKAITSLVAWHPQARNTGCDKLIQALTTWVYTAWAQAATPEQDGGGEEPDVEAIPGMSATMIKIAETIVAVGSEYPQKLHNICDALKNHSKQVAQREAIDKFFGLATKWTDSLVALKDEVLPALEAVQCMVIDGSKYTEVVVPFRAVVQARVARLVLEAASKDEVTIRCFKQLLRATELCDSFGGFAIESENGSAIQLVAARSNYVKVIDAALALKDALFLLQSETEFPEHDFTTTRKPLIDLRKCMKDWEKTKADIFPQMKADSVMTHLDTIGGHIGTIVRTSQDLIDSESSKMIPHYEKRLEQLKSRADKVAGGKNDNGSWKTELPTEADLGDAEATSAIAVVKLAYCEAIVKRTKEMMTVPYLVVF